MCVHRQDEMHLVGSGRRDLVLSLVWRSKYIFIERAGFAGLMPMTPVGFHGAFPRYLGSWEKSSLYYLTKKWRTKAQYAMIDVKMRDSMSMADGCYCFIYLTFSRSIYAVEESHLTAFIASRLSKRAFQSSRWAGQYTVLVLSPFQI